MLVWLTIALLGIGFLALGGYVALRTWKKGQYARVAVVALSAFISYQVVVAVYPRDSFYSEESGHRTGIARPSSAKIVFKKVSYPDFHGDYALEMLFEVSPNDFEWLERTLNLNPPAGDGAIGGMYGREAEAR